MGQVVKVTAICFLGYKLARGLWSYFSNQKSGPRADSPRKSGSQGSCLCFVCQVCRPEVLREPDLRGRGGFAAPHWSWWSPSAGCQSPQICTCSRLTTWGPLVPARGQHGSHCPQKCGAVSKTLPERPRDLTSLMSPLPSLPTGQRKRWPLLFLRSPTRSPTRSVRCLPTPRSLLNRSGPHSPPA